MKTLIVFYSGTGHTRSVAEVFAEQLGADQEEIKDGVDRKGVKGYLRSGIDALGKKYTQIAPVNHEPEDYDAVLLGTPVWALTVVPPIRAYVQQFQDVLREPKRRVGFFCTYRGVGSKRAFRALENLLGRPPDATLALPASGLTDDALKHRIGPLVESCKEKSSE